MPAVNCLFGWLILHYQLLYFLVCVYEAIERFEDRVFACWLCYFDGMPIIGTAKACYKLSRYRKRLIEQCGKEHISGS